MPLVAHDRVSLAFGHLPVLDQVMLRLERGERVSVVGRNGAGKSTLLRIVSGEQARATGSVWKERVLSIAWLEAFLTEYQGAVVFVTHDRTFLQRVATRIVEIDRGRLTSWPGDYATFRRRKDEWLANDAVRQDKFDKRLVEEETWLRQGVKARRTRNEGRVRALMAMRQERAARREAPGSVRLRIERAPSSGQVVLEADDVSKAFGSRQVVRRFSTRIMRG